MPVSFDHLSKEVNSYKNGIASVRGVSNSVSFISSSHRVNSYKKGIVNVREWGRRVTLLVSFYHLPNGVNC